MSLDNKLIVPSVERAVNDLEFSLECYGTQKLKIYPSDYRGLERVYWNYYTHDAKAITIDTEAGTLDLVNDKVDNLDIVPSHKYLLWGILDKNLQFSRYALTRWPKSAYTGISAGGNKGEITTFTGVDDAFQFTKGARVRVINDSEWNYGNILGVGSGVLQIELDNRSYGTNISLISGAEIMQFSRYRPFVVSNSGQTLYSNHYRLLGWCELGIDDGAGGGDDHTEDVMRVSRWTRKRLFYNFLSTVYSGTETSTAPHYLNMGKFVSPIATNVKGYMRLVCNTTQGGYHFVINPNNNARIALNTAVNSGGSTTIYLDKYYKCPLDPYYNIKWLRVNITNTPSHNIYINGYYEED